MSLVVPDGDWPVTKRFSDLTSEEIFDVLDQFEDYWDAALNSLDLTPLKKHTPQDLTEQDDLLK